MSQQREDRLAILASSKRQIGELEKERDIFKAKKIEYQNNKSVSETLTRTITRFNYKIAEMLDATRIYERSIL